MAYVGDKKREYQREWMTKRRQEWIDSKGGCCTKCGSTDSLEVDHIDPKLKTMHTASIWGRAEHIRFAELENCQVLCYDCHLEKTIAQRKPTTHGTYQMYQNHKCRCSVCRKYQSNKMKKYREDKRKQASMV